MNYGIKRAAKDAERFPNAVRSLAAAASRYIGPLKTELDRSTSDVEKGAMVDSIDLCEQIIAATGKLPPAPAKSKKN